MDLKTIGGMVARHLLTMAGGALVTGGYLQQGQVETFVGAGVFLLGLAWSAIHKRREKAKDERLQIMTAAAEAHAYAMKDAKVPRPSAQAIADRIPDPKVTAAVVHDVMTGG